ncbi:MAG: 6-carboxytetrahydropterin synthase [Planctomycetes bacterium]|nr:6-carboxytetrahydropterin synthase [Planctomycetota bacterium]
MFTITKRFDFSAAHQLPDHDGKCKNLHGHNYYVEVDVQGPLHTAGPEHGMVVDLGILSGLAKGYCDVVDHKFLNDILDYSTAELIAKNVADFFRGGLSSREELTVSKVRVQETDSGWATYEPD